MRLHRNQFRYAKRKCLNAFELIKRDRFIESCLPGDIDLFKELRKFKGTPEKVVTKIDGYTDPVSITDHLKGIYERLYNRTGSSEPLERLYEEVDCQVTSDSIAEVDKVTPDLIKKIIKEKIPLII